MKNITAEEAAEKIQNGDKVAFSGFTPAGCPKIMGTAIAQKAEKEHAAGRAFKIHVLSGASTGEAVDGVLSRAKAVASRTPYQTSKDMRDAINAGEIQYWDMHLSQVSKQAQLGLLGEIDYAIIEAASVNDQGEIVLSTGIGATPTYAQRAKNIFIELNTFHPQSIRGLHDIYTLNLAPNTQPIPLTHVNDRIGSDILKVDPHKIVGIIPTHLADQARPLAPSDNETDKIGEYVADFLTYEMKAGRIPSGFLPLQSGVGNVANAVLNAMANTSSIPPFTVYSEVIQDAVISGIESGKILFASGTSLSVTQDYLQRIYQNLDFFKQHLVLRPQEITNHPEIAIRLGLIAINTALEADIEGNVNSTHVLGNKLMNGIGGSADFSRNAQISIFTCRSTAKNNTISAIVPMCTHIDHSEHSVKVIITENGIADLRGKGPRERAQTIIDNCVHPIYKPILQDYLDRSSSGHEPFSIKNAFKMHEAFLETGDMRNVQFE